MTSNFQFFPFILKSLLKRGVTFGCRYEDYAGPVPLGSAFTTSSFAHFVVIGRPFTSRLIYKAGAASAATTIYLPTFNPIRWTRLAMIPFRSAHLIKPTQDQGLGLSPGFPQTFNQLITTLFSSPTLVNVPRQILSSFISSCVTAYSPPQLYT